MKRLMHWVLFGLLAMCASAAENKAVETVLKASRHLANQSSYAWISTSASAEGTLGWRQGPTHGRTVKGDLTHVSFMLGDNNIELAFKGTNSAIKLQDQWLANAELKDDRAWIGDRLRNYKIPAREAGFLARNVQDLHPVESSEGEFSGMLNKKAISQILSRGRDVIKDAPEMTGRVRFKVEKGQLTRYEYQLKGRMIYPSDPQEVLIDRTTVVEIKDVRNTSVELPEECLRKLQ